MYLKIWWQKQERHYYVSRKDKEKLLLPIVSFLPSERALIFEEILYSAQATTSRFYLGPKYELLDFVAK